MDDDLIDAIFYQLYIMFIQTKWIKSLKDSLPTYEGSDKSKGKLAHEG